MLPGYEGDAFMPCGWSITTSKDGHGVVSRVQDEGKPALRIRTSVGEQIDVRQGLVELAPGSTYSLGVSVKGSGHVRVAAYAEDPGPGQMLCNLTIEAAGQWKSQEKSATVGWHRHFAQYVISVQDKADVLIRDATFTAQSERPNPLAGVLTQKYGKDADTLYYEDFDGPTCSIKLSGATHLTDEKGGRFGRGLATTSDQGGLTAPLDIGPLPPQGTVEFWFKPTGAADQAMGDLPQHPPDHHAVQEGRQRPAAIHGQLRGLPDAGVPPRRQPRLLRAGLHRARRRLGLVAARHVAPSGGHVGRSGAAVLRRRRAGGRDVCRRNGAAAGPDHRHRAAVRGRDRRNPRLARLRYGPVMPVGAEPIVFASPVAASAAPAPTPAAPTVKEPSPADIAAERAKLVSPLPAPTGDSVIGSDRFAPAWEGMAGMKLQKDWPAPGIDAVAMNPENQIGRAAVCRLDKLDAGEYYVGLLVESGAPYWRTEYMPALLLVSAWVNGWPMRLSTTSDPVQVRPGTWLAELQSAGPVSLKEGDEIAVCPSQAWGGQDAQRLVRVVLYRKAPARPRRHGPHLRVGGQSPAAAAAGDRPEDRGQQPGRGRARGRRSLWPTRCRTPPTRT